MTREPFERFRQRLEQVGFRPSRRLGQNFLLDPSLHRAIAAAAPVKSADLVLEIGAGLGFLTRELAQVAPVLAVEIDQRLATILVQELADLPPGSHPVELLITDALAAGRLHPRLIDRLNELLVGDRALHVVANIPYAITGPLLAGLCCMEVAPTSIVLLVQWELAERMAAAVSDSERGALTVLVQACYQAEIVRRVGPQVFRPRPAVDSGVLRLVPRSDGAGILSWPAAQRVAFSRFLRGIFAARRKKVRNAATLQSKLSLLEASGEFDATLEARPQAVTVDQFLRLYQVAFQ